MTSSCAKTTIVRGLRVLEKHAGPVRPAFLCETFTTCGDAGPPSARLAHGDRPHTLSLSLSLSPSRGSGSKASTTLAPQFRDAAASFPNVFCKLSGLVTEADRPGPDDATRLRPVRASRTRPVRPRPPDVRLRPGRSAKLREVTVGSTEAVSLTLGDVSSDERAEIFGGTAARFYGL